jgi:hypothetical protein
MGSWPAGPAIGSLTIGDAYLRNILRIILRLILNFLIQLSPPEKLAPAISRGEVNGCTCTDPAIDWRAEHPDPTACIFQWRDMDTSFPVAAKVMLGGGLVVSGVPIGSS